MIKIPKKDHFRGRVKPRPGIPLFVAVASLAVAFLAAGALSDRVRWVDIVTLFGSGFGAGAGLVSALARKRQARRL